MKVELYIMGSHSKLEKADLGDEDLILMNYQFEDFANPTDIKNSYTQSIKLKGTSRNDSIFGNLGELQRMQGAFSFNPLLRSPFVIFNELGEKLEEGYIKVESITYEDGEHYYNATLYGTMGNIFYHLAYKDDGTKKTLADLDYLGGGENELTFNINKSFIRNEWGKLPFFDKEIKNISDVINFAPCYNGIPDRGFDANKIICRVSELGVPSSVEGYEAKKGKTIVTLPRKITEWEAGNIRTYQQRPVISMLSILKGIARDMKSRGVEFDYSDINNLKSRYLRTWVTLPMLKQGSVGSGSKINVEFTQESASYVNTNPLSRLNTSAFIPSDASVEGIISFTLQAGLYNYQGSNLLSMDGAYRHAVSFIQAKYVSAGSAIAGVSDIAVIGSSTEENLNALAYEMGYKPIGNAEYKKFGTNLENWRTLGGRDYQFGQQIELTFPKTDKPVTGIEIYINSYVYNVDSAGTISKISESPLPAMFAENGALINSLKMKITDLQQNMSYISSAVVTDAVMTKKSLLTTKHTPLEYLTSFAKVFGMVFLYDKERKVVRMVRRELFFGEESSPLNIEDRIDYGSMQVIPNGINAKYYVYGFKPSDGEFEKFYKENYGQDYGIQRVNTGYDFDANSNDVMSKVIFRNAVSSMEQSPDFATFSKGSLMYPASIMRGGGKYTLWKGDDSREFEIPITGISPIWWNKEYKGYDYEGAYKMQFHDRAGKPLDGSDVLCFYVRNVQVEGISLTDDTADMASMNAQVPCWELAPTIGRENLPVFSRSFEGVSLDFGVPKEINAPARSYDPSATIYQLRWKRFVEDRLSVNSKVVNVKVNFTGMKVDEKLLRKFYWFDGCVWSLNRIINHSLTTNDLTECEFVKVQNIDNYKS